MTTRSRRPRTGGGAPRLWLELLLALAVTLVLMALGLFGQSDVLEHYGQVVFTQVFSPSLYTAPGGEPGAGSRDRTVVVLLRDEDLAELDWAWPMTYEAHGLVLQEIRRRKPRALVIDFLFVDRRPVDDGLGDLVEELREYDREGIPVFLASAAVPGPAPAVLPELVAARVQLVPVPRLLQDEAESSYPLAFERCEERGSDPDGCRRRTRRPTAAAAVYHALCGGPPGTRCAAPVLAVEEARELRPEGGSGVASANTATSTPRVEVFWGTKPEPLSARRIECREPPAPEVWKRFWTAARQGGTLRHDCPFTPTVYVSWLFRWGAREDASLWRLINGDRVVFYGASLAGMSDPVRPPGHDPLPAVYLHAMALDNLLTFGADYRRQRAMVGDTRMGRALEPWLPGSVPRWTVSTGRVAIATVILQLALGVPVYHLRERWLGAESGPARALGIEVACWLLYVVLAAALVLTITWAQWAWLGLTVGNWLEGFLDAFLGRHVATRVMDRVTALTLA